MLLFQQVCFVKGKVLGKVLLQLYLFNAPGAVTEVAPESTSQNTESSICFTLIWMNKEMLFFLSANLASSWSLPAV